MNMDTIRQKQGTGRASWWGCYPDGYPVNNPASMRVCGQLGYPVVIFPIKDWVDVIKGRYGVPSSVQGSCTTLGKEDTLIPCLLLLPVVVLVYMVVRNDAL